MKQAKRTEGNCILECVLWHKTTWKINAERPIIYGHTK
jgi:hypothetical protein